MQHILEQTKVLLEQLGHNEMPLGISYTDVQPADAFVPKKGAPISRELEDKGEIDWKGVFSQFSCLIGNIWLARKKRRCAALSAENYGCMGGAHYTGFCIPYVNAIPHYVSTGIPGVNPRGERYLPSVAAMEEFLATVAVQPAPAPWCVVRPFEQCTDDTQPEFITFFVRGEVLSGLCSLAWYATGDVDLVRMPFGAGCTNIVGWPRHYQERGEERVVLGGLDLSCRKFVKADEMTWTVPFSLFKRMLRVLPESSLAGDTWEGVRKKVLRSQTAWKEHTGQ